LVRRTIAIGAVIAGGFLGEFAFAFLLLPLLQHYLPVVRHLGLGLPGYVLAVYGLARLAGQMPLGALADALDHRIAVSVGYLLVLIAGLIFWSPVPVAVLLIAAALFGLGHALADPIIPAALAESTEAGSWGRVLGLLNLSQVAGLVAGLAIGAFVADLAPSSAGFLLVALANGLALILLALPAGPLLRRRGLPRSAYGRQARTVMRLSGRMGYLLATIFALALAVGMLTPDLDPFAVTRLHASPHVLTLYLLPAGVLGLAALPFGGWLADRLGRLPPMLAGAAVGALALALLTHIQQPWQAAIAAVFVASGLAVTMPASNAALLDEAQPERRAFLLSGMMAAQGLAQAAGPFFGGIVLGFGGASAPVAAAAVALWLCVPLAVLYASSPVEEGASVMVAYTPFTRFLSSANLRAHEWYVEHSTHAAATEEERRK
jgi:MFS family permease